MAENFYEMYLEEMGGITPLTEQEKKALLKETARGDAGARSRLVEGSLRHVLDLVSGYEGRELPMSDIVQEANTALMLAAIEYDESEPWDGLVERRVREAVELALEEQRAEAEIEENMAARVNVLQTVSQMMAKELGGEATLQELAVKMKMTEEEIKDIMKLALDALTVNGEGRALGETEDDTDSSNPIKDGWSMEER